MNYEQKIAQIISGQSPAPMPHHASLLAKYLENFRPSAAVSDRNMNSYEIKEAFSEIVDYTINEIATVMEFLGYEPVGNISLEWGMTPYFE